MTALVIPIHDLDSSGKDFVFALDEAWLAQAFRETPGVRGDGSRESSVEVHAQRNGREVLVHGRAHAWLVTECVRCMQNLPVEVGCELAALYAPSEGGPRPHAQDDEDEEIELKPGELDREYYRGEQVVIDGLVRDYLLLELPMQPRCELGWECPNLDLPSAMRSPSGAHSVPVEGAPNSGEDVLDPRLKPLQKLAKGEPDKE